MTVDIKSFEGIYTVNDSGQIFSIRNNRYIASNKKRSNEYCHVGLYNGSIKKLTSVHRVVAEAFIPNPDNKPNVNHINGIKHDNRAKNLEWCTQKENVHHAIRTGLNNPLIGIAVEIIQLSQDDILKIRNKDKKIYSILWKIGLRDRAFYYLKEHINEINIYTRP